MTVDPAELSRAGTDLCGRFRAVMASVCGPVAVVTSADGGAPHGTSVSAFTSLSMDPPMILVCLDRKSDLLALLRTTRTFGVNILADDQADIAHRFSRRGLDRFDGVDWSLDGGRPRLTTATGWVGCSVADLFDGGDHTIVTGRVLTADAGGRRSLTYGRHTFGTHVPLEPRVQTSGGR